MSASNHNFVHLFSHNNSPGFWEIGAYKANVQRIKDGSTQLNELTKLIKERVELENRYGKSLQAWNQKWATYSERQMPNGHLKDCLNGIISESKLLASVHLAVRDRFNDEVIETIAKFKKENYHRYTIRGFKEPKEIEEEFEKAQQRWKKLFERVEASKKFFYICRRTEKAAYIQMVNTKTDSTTLQDGSDKNRERYEKCKEQTKKSRMIYEQNLREISKYNPVYVENMAFVFEKCQQIELKRMKFFAEMLSGMQKILVDIVLPPKLVQLHKNLEKKFSELGDVQFNQDLKQWSLMYGKDVKPNWPVFEEYVPEIHNISKSNNIDNNAGVILTKKIMKSENDDLESRHNSVGNSLALEKNANQVRNISHSSQDVFRLINKQSNNGARLNDSYITGIHSKRRVSSFENVKDNLMINSEILNVSIKDDTFSPNNYGKCLKNSDPFFDPFPMPTPQRPILNAQKFSNSSTSNSHSNENNFYSTVNENKKLEQKHINHNLNNQTNKNQQNINIIASSSSVESNDAVKENILPSSNIYSFDHNEQEQRDVEFRIEKVLALYDYNPNEDDELSLVKGEFIEMLRPADNLGWCYGRKNQKNGFFPAGYVTKINN